MVTAETVARGVVAFVLRRPLLSLLSILGVTAFFAYQASKVEMFSQFSDLLPQKHSYVQEYNNFKQEFGGANIVTLVLQVREGDIFSPVTLNKIKYLTEQLDLIDGVNHYQVASIAHQKIRRVETIFGGLVQSRPVLPYDIPTDPKELRRLKEEMFNNDVVYNKLISADGKAALLLAGFYEERLDYRNIHREISRLKGEVEDDNHRLYVAGEPMLKGWVWYFTNELYMIFAVTALFILTTLLLYFRRLYGIFLPLVGTVMSAVWGLGFAGLLGYNLDPLILVIPLLISARAVSHGVQMVERFFEEYEMIKDKECAVSRALEELFVPAAISIETDALGVLTLAVATIPLIRKLAFYASFWSFSNVFTVSLFIPLLLLYLPAPRRTEHHIPRVMMWVLPAVARWVTRPRVRWVFLGIGGLSILVSVWQGSYVTVGDQEPGSPLLWPEAEYNVSSWEINRRFAGANQLVIYLEGKKDGVLKDPSVMATLESLRRYMLEQEEAGDTRDLPTLVSSVNRLYHYDDPKWGVPPGDVLGIGNMVFMYEAGAPVPGVIKEYMDFAGKDGQFVVFYKDTRADTIAEALLRVKNFTAAHPLEGVTYRLAGGLIGVTAALNDEVAYSETWNTLLIMAAVFLSVVFTYRSLVAGLLVMMTLVTATLVNFFYMGINGIPLNINSLPVTTVGIGIGVDYSLYIIDRIKQEYRRLGDIDEAIRRAIVTSGMAVTFTATTLVGGILPWYFLSSLRFSAEMSLLLSMLMVTNWLGAITLIPALFSVVRPRFVTGGAQVVREGEELGLAARMPEPAR